MTKRILQPFGARVGCVAFVVACTVATGLAADNANYSGRYSLQSGTYTFQGRKTASGSDTDSTLEVVQNADSIEITRVEKGKTTTNRYPLKGLEGDCTTPTGVAGKCKAQVKNKYLELESIVAVHPKVNGYTFVPPRFKERWQLSAESKTLTVKSWVDFPNAGGDAPSVLLGAHDPRTQKYKRIESP